MMELQKIIEDFHNRLLSTQVLIESLSDILIAKGVTSKDEIESYCTDKVKAIELELKKIREDEALKLIEKISKQKQTRPRKSKKIKSEEIDDEPTLTSMFMGNQIGEA